MRHLRLSDASCPSSPSSAAAVGLGAASAGRLRHGPRRAFTPAS